MKTDIRSERPFQFRLILFTAFLITTAAVLVEFFLAARADDIESASATWTHGALHVAIPYRGLHAGGGTLVIEVLDPEDRSLGRVERHLDVHDNGAWRQDVGLSQSVGLDDLVWHRLHYRFAYDGRQEAAAEGTDSISTILRMPVVHILGQQSYLAGGQAAIRVIVTDSKNEIISGPAGVRVELVTPERKSLLYSGRLNARGTAEAQFRFPAGLTGSYSLRYAVETPIGAVEYTQAVRLEDKASILLTTEKPIYQPGQTIHVRALALDRANHAATAARKLTFEVEDSRGNKVFRKAAQTDKFGVASAEFALADEVNLGTYHLRALMGDDPANAANRAEIALNVERYVLPKFKVAVDFAGGHNQSRHGYRPGEHVTGAVRANYFFGKPVGDAEIAVKATGMDVSSFDAGSAKGRTGADGAYRFDLTLPSYFAGKPLGGGAARVLIEATVKDSAGHAETRGEPITVSESPLLITAVPEGGKLVPGLENQIFILTSYADGKPAATDLKVLNQSVSTDASGVAVIRMPAGASNTLRVEAADKEGNRAAAELALESRDGSDQVLLHTERAVYRAGDRVQLRVHSTKKQGAAYVDVVREGQTVFTRDLEIVNGQAELSFTATPELAGTVDVSAYLFGADARPQGDHRLIFVQPADELKVEATADAAVYKPGDDAKIRFHVTNARGEGVQAALGLQVVDEAVFALAEKQPGFAKVFFYLEQEAMKPRYEIHSLGMPEVVEQGEDRAARALFAATETVSRNQFRTEFGRSAPRAKYAQYSQRFHENFYAQLRRSADRLMKGSPEIRDAWGTPVRVARISAQRYYTATSAGPDKQFGTADDLWAWLEVRTRKVAAQPSPVSLDVKIEHDRGPFNGFAEIAGSVFDQTGAAIAGTTVSARELSSGRVRTVKTNAGGDFSLAGLPAGTFEVAVSAPGFQVASRKVALIPRDRAVVTATLAVGNVLEAVTVTAGAPVMNAQMAIMGEAPLPMRGAGGIGGGVGHGLRDFDRLERFAKLQRAPAPMLAASSAIIVKKEDAPAARVRSYFPEALYINPEIITDGAGRATISIPLADSITTWRMAMLASTARGALGSATSSLKVFQDFFVDLDLPVTLTQGDRVSLPLAVYNYSGARGDVDLRLQPDDWFDLVEDAGEKHLAVDAGRVGGSQFTLQAKRIGKFKLTVAAHMDGAFNRADIVVREIEVIPNGREQNIVFNGRLESTADHALNFPANAIPDASRIFVRLYPGPLSQVIEGMDAILRMPGGCFEQTSSSTYPNVLALDYMKRTRKLTPEVHAKAEGFVANGYQRLLTFEVPGGGFSWFGQAPANKILTSYGLMEFSDMSKVHDVDPKLIARTQQWLAAQQQADGSWKPDTQFINEGATNRYNSDLLRITAYIAWALGNTGYQGPAVVKAKQFVEGHLKAKVDAYTLAVLANFAADFGKDREFTNHAIQLLLDARTEKDDQAWWSAEETGVYARGASAAVETTGLAVQALLKSGQASATARKALTYIAAKKDASGTWGTTQATIMALRAVLLSTEKGSADVRGTLEISLDGKPVRKLDLTPDNNDLLHQFVFKGLDAKAANHVSIRFAGKGGLAYQVVGQYFVPWADKPAHEPLSIDVAYDRTRLAQDDIATATATVRNNLRQAANMVMVDLGIPPGFDLLSEDLQAFQEKTAGRKGGRLEKFSLTATQAILYFDSIPAGDTVKIEFRLRAKYPIRARTFQSRVYEYYDPEVSAVARPVQLEVRKR